MSRVDRSAAGQHTTKGSSTAHELHAADLFRDTRSLWSFVKDALASPLLGKICLVLCILAILVFPSSIYIVLLIATPLYFNIARNVFQLPVNMPVSSGQLDYNMPKPGTNRTKFEEASGHMMLGNATSMEKFWELWANIDLLLRHIMVFGRTGAGKTEVMLGFSFHYLMMGGGLIFNDAKATNKLAWQLYTQARYFGRDDEFRSINYLTGNRSDKPDPAEKRSSTSNPYAFGSADSATQTTVQLMPDGGQGGNDPNKLFSERAVGLISAINPALVELRDKELLQINPGVLRKYMEFQEVIELSKNPHISSKSREAINSYIASLAGFNPKIDMGKQPAEVTRQFGFAQAYFTRALSMLTDTYGYIFMEGMPEVDFQDLVRNNRILVTMLPAMEKSSSELSGLAKIILASIRNAMATGLGDKLEGHREDVIDNLPSSSNAPTGIINDEYAYMAVKDFAVTAAQARGMFFSLIFGAQDYSGMKAASDREAEQIIENTMLKYFMAGEAAGDTLDLLQRIVGKAYYSRTSGYHWRENQSFDLSMREQSSTQIEQSERLNVQDLRDLDKGEAYIIYKSAIIKSEVFYHGFDEDDLTDSFELVRMLKIDLPRRGKSMDLFYPGFASTKESIEMWARNTTAAETQVTCEEEPPLTIKKLFADVYSDDIPLDSVRKSLCLIANYDGNGSGLPVKDNSKSQPVSDDVAEALKAMESEASFSEPSEKEPQAEAGSSMLSNAGGNAFRMEGGDTPIPVPNSSSEIDTAPVAEVPAKPQEPAKPASEKPARTLTDDLKFSEEDHQGSLIPETENPEIMTPDTQKGFMEVADSDLGPADEDYLPEDVKDHPIIKAKKNTLNNIGKNIKAAEEAGGATETLAHKRAKQTVGVVSNSILHPKPPTPDASEEHKAILKGMLETWLGDGEEG